MNNSIMIILRILHIGAGTFWVGSSLFLALVVVPSAKKAGTGAYPFMASMSQSIMGVAFPIAAVTTTLAGLILYYEVSGEFNTDYMKSGRGIVLGIGALAGILAFGHGFGVGKISDRFGKLVEGVVAKGTSVSAESQREVDTMFNKLSRNVNISLGLMIIAVIGMASARYVG